MERVLANKVNWLAEHDYELMVVTTDQRGREPYFKMHLSIVMKDLDINYDETNGKLWKKLATYPIKQYRHRRRLSRLLKEYQADIVVCMFNNDVSFVHQIKDGSLKVLEVHFSRYKKLQYARSGLWALADRWRTRSEEAIVKRYAQFVVLTEEDKKLWGNVPNITVIPNARTFEPASCSDCRQKHVLAIGRYDYQKGFDTLLNIWGRLDGLSTEWTLDIVGDGPLRETLERKVTELKLRNVQLLHPTSDIQSMYLQASIVVMTSHYEGLPMVLIEAQSYGLPIVAFACQCGPRDILTDGLDGYLIEGRDEETFASRLASLMSDEEKRREMGSAAVKASKRFSEDYIMQQWDALFHHLCGS